MAKTTAIVVKQFTMPGAPQDIDWIASCLPEDFCHVVLIPTEVHPFGVVCKGKAAIDRLRAIASEFDFIKFDTNSLITDTARAAAEIPVHYRHRGTGLPLQSTFVNFWTFQDNRPIKLVEYHDIPRIQDFMTHMTALAEPKV
jgi:hypothetical protein